MGQVVAVVGVLFDSIAFDRKIYLFSVRSWRKLISLPYHHHNWCKVDLGRLLDTRKWLLRKSASTNYSFNPNIKILTLIQLNGTMISISPSINKIKLTYLDNKYEIRYKNNRRKIKSHRGYFYLSEICHWLWTTISKFSVRSYDLIVGPVHQCKEYPIPRIFVYGGLWKFLIFLPTVWLIGGMNHDIFFRLFSSLVVRLCKVSIISYHWNLENV